MRLRATLLVLILAMAPAYPIFADQRFSDLLLQVQRLQEEVQQLRGRLEVQAYELSTLRRQQQEQYLDLDARLRGRSEAAPTTGVPDAGAPGTVPATPTAASGNSVAEKDAYRVAFDLLKQRRYEDAIRAFEDLLARYPNGEFADNARFWLGEANYVKQDYSAALTQFQRVLANYPLSPKVPASMLKIGYVHYEQGDWRAARTALQDVLVKFPDTAEAQLAESRLERMSREGH